MSNIAPIAYDAESEAYLQRYPELRGALQQYGANGARLHWQNYGQKEGRTWGAAAPVAAAPAGPVETVSTAPMPEMYGNDAASWDAYMKAGRTATEGMNQMPGVFSDYGSVPTDDKAANALFYPSSAGKAVASNPLFAGLASMATGMGTGGGLMAAGVQGNPLLSGQSTFDRIIDAGPEAFSNGLITEYGLRGGMTPEEMSFYLKGRQYYGG